MRVSARFLALATALGIVSLLGTVAVSTAMGMGAAGTTTAGVKTPYTVTFSETGLPTGTTWSVHVAYIGCGCDGVRKTVSSDVSTLTIPVTNGSYHYNVLRVPGYFVNVSAQGTFNVSDANVSAIPIQFHVLVPFLAVFTETGLPSGTLWTVSLLGNGHGQERTLEDQTASSYGTSLNFSLPNGTYHYSVANVPGSFFVNHSGQGKFVIAGAPPAQILVKFLTPPIFAVTFSEKGLPVGTNWSVRVHGWGGVLIEQTHSSTTTNVTFLLPNGTYDYAIAQVLGFDLNGSIYGSFAVAGAPHVLNVTFLQIAPGAFYPVAFEESGLASGTHWSVTVTLKHTFGHSRSLTQSSNSSKIFFLLQNGSFRFQVHGPRTYTITAGGSGNLTIAGSSPSVFLVNFTAIPTYSLTFTESGLPSGTNWSVLVRTQTPGSTPWPIHTVGTSNTTTVTFSLPNGTYCYSVYSIPGYQITSGNAASSFTVSGASPPGVTITFSPKA